MQSQTLLRMKHVIKTKVGSERKQSYADTIQNFPMFVSLVNVQ
uniref:Uncharacterized protein n=1 Tax=Arundo donax TaxID=35708 RepID=A0A0A8ZAD5_ARUDO